MDPRKRTVPKASKAHHPGRAAKRNHQIRKRHRQAKMTNLRKAKAKTLKTLLLKNSRGILQAIHQMVNRLKVSHLRVSHPRESHRRANHRKESLHQASPLKVNLRNQGIQVSLLRQKMRMANSLRKHPAVTKSSNQFGPWIKRSKSSAKKCWRRFGSTGQSPDRSDQSPRKTRRDLATTPRGRA